MTVMHGLDVQVSAYLPISPTPEEVGKRIARHVFADELISLGREVGPKWNDRTHVIKSGNTLIVSNEMYEIMRREWPND
jgi:hypothetical protein